MSEPWRFGLWIWGTHELVFFGVWGAYALLHRRGVAPRFRVVEGKAPAAPLVRAAIRGLPAAHLGFLALIVLVVHPAWRAMGGHMGGPWPSPMELGWQLVACMLVQDTIFYWGHRALHTKRLFRAIHRKHHDFRYVRGVSAEYAHPVESLLNVTALMVGPVLLAVHPVTFVVWQAIRVGESVEAHSGYAFTRIASRHAYHHLYAARGCLGSFFGIWDRLMGTDAHWQQWRRDQPHR